MSIKEYTRIHKASTDMRNSKMLAMYKTTIENILVEKKLTDCEYQYIKKMLNSEIPVSNLALTRLKLLQN